MGRILCVTVCLVSCLDAALAQAQEAPLFKSSVAVVPISALVRDDHGRAIMTLRASDFEVRDNGERRPILAFEVDRDAPLTIAVLVDTSGSMRSKLASARRAVAAIARELRDGIDAAALFTFDAALHEVSGFTQHPASLDTALTGAAPFGATSLYDAIAETAQRLEAQAAGRRAVIVVTDGVDTMSARAPAEVSARASALDVPVYVIATVPRIDEANYVSRASNAGARSAADVHDLANWTGGDLLWANSESGGASAARQILSELRHLYLLGVDSAADGSWRRLDIKVRDRRMTVRARSGYVSRDRSSSR